MADTGARAGEARPDWDLLKCYGVVLVLVIHVSAPGAYLFAQVSRADWFVASGLNSFSRVAVPLFLMASGAALLDTRRVANLGDFFARRVRRVVVPLLFWSLLYLADRAWIMGQPVTGSLIVRNLLGGTSFYHLPFLYYLLGLYLCAPVLASFAERAGRAASWYFVGLWFALSCAAVFSDLTQIIVNIPVPVVMGFAGYFVAGRLLRDVAIERWAIAACVALVAAGTAATLLLTFRLTKQAGALNEMFFEYGRPNVIVMTLAGYLLLTSGPVRRWLARSPRVAARLAAGAAISFGIYLLHPLLLQLVLPRLRLAWNTLGPVIGIPLSVAVLLALSGAAIALLRRVPGLRQAVG